MANLPLILTVLITFIIAGSLASMALLSFAVNALALIILVLWIKNWVDTKTPGHYWKSLGPDYSLWAFWAVVAIGAFTIDLIPAGDGLYVASQGKWILFLYAMTTAIAVYDLRGKTLVQVMIWLCLPIAIHGIYQSFTGGDWIRSAGPSYAPGLDLFRARGFNHNPMTFAHCLAVLISGLTPFLFFRVFREKRLHEILLWCALLLATTALVLTFTRGAWIALIAQAIIVFSLWNFRHALKILGVFAVIVVLMVALVPSVKTRVQSIGDSKDFSSNERVLLWESNWHMFLDHPILGVGAGRNRLEVEKYNMKLRGDPLPNANAHNNFLHVMAGTGSLGFISWTIFMVAFAVGIWRRYKNALTPYEKALHLGTLGALIAFHVGGLTQTTFDDKEVLMLLLTWLALSIATPSKANA